MRSAFFRAFHRATRARSEMSRRGFLKGSVAMAALAGVSACAKGGPFMRGHTPSVGILGGGAAGLSAAHTLIQGGIRPVIFEAAHRLGGRMFTADNFTASGQFAELGGEFVDSNHTALRSLCAQLGLTLEALEEEGEDRFFLHGNTYTAHDMLDGKGGGAFARLAKQIARDVDSLYTDSDDWSEAARALDRLSLEAYLQRHRALAPAWMFDLLRIAYTGEMGLEPGQQSCLNMIDFIATDHHRPFELFGESDEAWRIPGGSSRLIEALESRITNRADIRLDSPVQRLSRSPDGRLTVHTAQGADTFDTVLCTLPFTILRSIEGLDTLGLPVDKIACIQELGYGTNAKVLLSTKDRSWRDSGSNGTFYTDTGAQTFWETSRKQPGKTGVWTNFLGGNAGLETPAQRLATARRDGERLAPDVQWAGDSRTFFWAAHPTAKGSYACLKPGQYCDFIATAARPECEGRLLFAGEHTSEISAGYMNGAVETGLAAGNFITKHT